MGGEVLARVPLLLEGPAGGAATSASGAVSARAVSERASIARPIDEVVSRGSVHETTPMP